MWTIVCIRIEGSEMADSIMLGSALAALAASGATLLVFVGVGVWMIWTGAIKPRIVPAHEIDRAAAELVAGYADPEGEAFARHERAWYESDSAGQVYWRRVRRVVRSRVCSIG